MGGTMSLANAHAQTSLPVKDFERAVAWYRDVLGLEPATKDEQAGARYELVDGSAFFLYPSPFAGTNQATAMSFGVDDFDATITELRRHDVVFQEYDFEDFSTDDGVFTAPDGSKVAWFVDPEGNILAVSHGL
jgi:catechol 2,3-dioxygenase-like lactoylglutathione lyase family enzyme